MLQWISHILRGFKIKCLMLQIQSEELKKYISSSDRICNMKAFNLLCDAWKFELITFFHTLELNSIFLKILFAHKYLSGIPLKHILPYSGL